MVGKCFDSIGDAHTTYQPCTPYNFLDMAQTRFRRSTSLQQGQDQVKVTS